MNGTCGACGFALAAQTTFCIVDVGHIVFDDDGIESALFDAFAATDTGGFAGFARHTAFVLVDARYEYAAIFRTFFAQFDDVFRAGFCAGTAGRTLVVIDFGQPCLGIHVYGAELAGSHTVATTKTAVATAGLAGIQIVHDDARTCAVVLRCFRTIGTRTVAAHYGD